MSKICYKNARSAFSKHRGLVNTLKFSGVWFGALSKETQSFLRKAKPADRLLYLLLFPLTACYLPTTLNANFILCSGVLEVANTHVAWIFF